MKRSKVVKRFFLFFGIFLLLIIGALASIPFLFKDQLLASVRKEINANLNAEVNFSDASLSLLRSFPNLTLTLEDLSVKGQAPFDGIELMKVSSLRATVDIMSVIKGDQPVQIQGVSLVKPRLRVLILADGRANYDIAKPSETETPEAETGGEIAIKLKRFSIDDGELVYDDRAGDMFVEIIGLNHQSRGDLSRDVYDLTTQTEISALTYKMGGISYLSKAKIDLDAVILAEMAQTKFTLKDNTLFVNALQLKADGFVAMPDDENIDMDLSFQAPGGDFRELFSLIPNAFIEGYENVDIKGQFSLKGHLKGRYNDEQYPAIQLNATVDNGSVRYPDLHMSIGQISANLNIDSPEGSLDGMFIDLDRFTVKVGDNPFGGYLKLRTPLSDPDMDARVKGKIDLAQLAQSFPMEETKGMAGLITADVEIKTRLSTIEREAYEDVKMEGDIMVQQINYPMEGFPTVNIREAKVQFTPKRALLEQFDAQLGKSDLRASGSIDNILAYISPEKTMKGVLAISSNFFDANEWLTEEESADPDIPVSEAVAEEAPFDRFDFLLDAKIGKLLYYDYELTNVEARGQFTPTRMSFSPLNFKMGESDISMSGVITNVWDFAFGEGVLGGAFSLNSNYFDLNPFMTEEESSGSPSETAEYEPIEVPANINVSIDAKIKKLVYTDLVLENMSGRLLIEDRAAIIERMEANGLDGKIGLAGSYDTKDPQKPVFTLKYDLQNLSFQKAFNTFNTFQVMAPIGQYINGKFNSTMIMDSELGPDLMPVWSTVSADGFLQTFNAVLQGFPPLQAVGQKLNVDYFNNLPISNTKNWFELKNGALELKEFDYSVKGIDMKIGGTHNISKDMNYRILAKIPRAMLEKTSIGGAAGAGLDALQQEAGKLGLNLSQSEFVNVLFNITGTSAKPQVSMKLVGIDGQSSVAEAAIETIKDEIKEQKDKAIEAAKEQAEAIKEQVRDTITTVIQKETQEAKDKAKEAIDQQAKKTEEQIKKELDQFNPFKKKKKD